MTPTPDASSMWTLEAGVNALGTPYPAMDVVIRYRVDAGDAAIILFLAALLLLFWIAVLTLKPFERN